MPEEYTNTDALLDFISSGRVRVSERPVEKKAIFEDEYPFDIVFDLGLLSNEEKVVAVSGIQEIGTSVGYCTIDRGNGPNEWVSLFKCAEETKAFLEDKGIEISAAGIGR